MIKKLLASLLLLSGATNVATAQHTKAGVSAFTRKYLHEISKPWNKGKPVEGYVYKVIGGKIYVSAFVRVIEDEFDEAALGAMGVYVGTKAGRVWTVQIPIDKMDDFLKLNGLAYIDLDAPISPYLDAARKSTKADSAQMGYDMPLPVSGENVVVGIIDAGFDYNHPTFYDSLHSAYRVRRVWAQKGIGTPPYGFAYGRELDNSYAIRSAGYDTAITTHGTHVAGIAAGSGFGSTGNKLYRGMAYESDLVFVGIMPEPMQWVVAGASDVVDGMNYIFSYASSVYKPAIANLSWGSSMGPHDGLSLFSEACDALTGPGKIFACSAGNSGQDTIHLRKTFTTTDNKVSTFVTFSPYLDTTNQKTWVDVWGDTAKAFCLKLKLYDAATGTDSTATLCLADTTQEYTLMGSDGNPCYVSISMVVNEYNGKPHAFVSLHSLTHNNVCLTASGTTGTIDMWEGYLEPPTGYYGAFKKLGYSFAVSGDTKMTVSDISSSYSAICVGAYTSKRSFTNISGATLSYSGAINGRIAPFSSLGPLPDGRIKPDITGPGFALASSVSSYDVSYAPGGDNYNAVVSDVVLGGRTYPYAMAAGTSMSSPATSGIIALMLQLNSTLTPDSVKSIMAITAIKDISTGTIPAEGNTVWGHGKVNAYLALKYMAEATRVENTLTKETLDCVLYPNPSDGKFSVLYNGTSSEVLKVVVFDVTGKIISSFDWSVGIGYNTRRFDIGNIPEGLYFTRISSGNKANVIKTLIK